MGVTPKSSLLVGFSIMNYPIWGTSIYGNPHLVRGFSASMFDDTSPIFGHPTAAAEVAPQALLERAGAAPAANSLIRPEKDGKIPQLC